MIARLHRKNNHKDVCEEAEWQNKALCRAKNKPEPLGVPYTAPPWSLTRAPAFSN